MANLYQGDEIVGTVVNRAELEELTRAELVEAITNSWFRVYKDKDGLYGMYDTDDNTYSVVE